MVNVQATLPGGTIIQGTSSGTAFVVVNDPPSPANPIGRGWSVGGTAQLVSDGNGGYFWIDGATGGVRDFEQGNGTNFVSPPNDQGNLVETSSGTFTYTNPQQFKWNFTTVGGQILLASIMQPDGPTETFVYNSDGRVSAVTVPGGWTATFMYDSNNQLSGIAEAGNRVLTLTHDSSDDLTEATLPDGSVRSYTYDSVGHMLTAAWGDQLNTYTYDPTTGALIDTNTGQGRMSESDAGVV